MNQSTAEISDPTTVKAVTDTKSTIKDKSETSKTSVIEILLQQQKNSDISYKKNCQQQRWH